MPSIEARNFASPDETRTPDRTRVDMVRMGETSAARLELAARLALVGVHQAGRGH